MTPKKTFSHIAAAGTLALTLALTVSAVAPIPSVGLISTGGFANAVSIGVVGGRVGNHAVLWSNGQALDVHPAAYTFSAISGRRDGLSVGYAGTPSTAQAAIVWRGTLASTLPVPFDSVTGRAVATDGVQIVGYANEGDPERTIGDVHALLWNAATGEVTDLGRDRTLYGVGGGVQVGITTGSNGSTAALWRGTPNSFVNLHVQGQDVSVATATNGPIQVGYVGLDVRVRHEGRPRNIRFYSAGLWTGTAASFTYLPSPYRHSFALAITGDGDTIVGYGNTTDAIGTPRDSHAVAWVGPNHTVVDLHALLPADMRTSLATAVDEQGNIVGYGVTTDGTVRSYIWRLADRPRMLPVEP
jgi:hypothetical protein